MIKGILSYNLSLKSLIIIAFKSVATILYSIILSRNYLERNLLKKLSRDFFPRWKHTILFKSGRSALHGLLEGIKKSDSNYSVIFLPDYICNVVYQASDLAGYRVQSYPTDNDFSPIWTELFSVISSESHPVVLLASMFGKVNSTQDSIEKIKAVNPAAFIVADECQHLVKSSPVGFTKNMGVVFSFNKKTIPGLMGGGVSINEQLVEFIRPLKLSWLAKLELNVRLVIHLFREFFEYIVICFEWSLKNKKNLSSFEYSYGTNIVYDTQPNEIAKVSLVRSLLELRRIDTIQNIRKRNSMIIKTAIPEALICPKLPYLDLAAYIPIRKKNLNKHLSGQIFFKRPYAIHNQPERSVKDIFCIMNSVPLPLKIKKNEE